MRLVNDWTDWPRWVSTWCEAAAAAFFSTLLVAPDAVLQLWAVLPADMRAAIPAEWVRWLGVALIVAGSAAKLVDQPRLNEKRRKGESDA